MRTSTTLGTLALTFTLSCCIPAPTVTNQHTISQTSAFEGRDVGLQQDPATNTHIYNVDLHDASATIIPTLVVCEPGPNNNCVDTDLTHVESTAISPADQHPAATDLRDANLPDKTPPTPNAITTTLDLLISEEIPERDLRELAMRVRGIPSIPIIVDTVLPNYSPNDTVEFTVTNTDSDHNFNITARLVYQTPIVYFFAQNGLEADEVLVRKLVDDFDQHTYPVVREFFGNEWTPGVDDDPHLYILYASDLGSSIAGYYSSIDQYSHLAHEFSNEKEMFYINADVVNLDDTWLPGILAHEFQHMVHWAHDQNEDTWMNEGASVLAEFLTGNSLQRFVQSFIANPDLQLNSWSDPHVDSNATAHYGASFLFMNYFLGRFGENATRALIAHPSNGIQAVDAVLFDLEFKDPLSGSPITAEDVFSDWVVANYVADTSWSDGRYGYDGYLSAPRAVIPTETLHVCPSEILHGTVHQYAADYIEITCDGTYTVSFTGNRYIDVVPAKPHSGRYSFWSNRSDSSDTILTRRFDLTPVDAATLKYWAWWDLEKHYDYAYLEISDDGGHSWNILETPGGTDVNPSGNNLGWGYNHKSGGEDIPVWVHESVDLSPYAGNVIHIRFEYVTDDAINRPGILLDDISIPEIGYTEDFDESDSGWESEGWVRFDNLLPQTWILQIVQNQHQNVASFDVESGQRDITLSGPATLIVSGTTPFTTEISAYEILVQP